MRKFNYLIALFIFYFGTCSVALAEVTCRVNGKITQCPDWILNISPLFFIAFFVIWAVFMIFFIITLWKLFKKADQPGWASIVPFYNFIIMLKIGGLPEWWIILLFIPLVNIIISIIMINSLSKAFGKGTGFTIGLLILPFVFFPILAFGKSQYIPLAKSATV